EADKAYRRSSDICEKLVSDFPEAPQYRDTWSSTLNNWGRLLASGGELTEARRRLRQAVEQGRKAVELVPDSSAYRRKLCNCYANLAVVLTQLGEHAE